MDPAGKVALFRDVVDCKSFSQAAVKHGLTHSTVSKHVKKLEQLYGARLLVRTSRSMSLTEPGRLVYEAGAHVNDAIESLEARLAEWRGAVSGELKLTSLFHLAPRLVQPAIDSFLAEHEHARVKLVLNDGPLAFSRDGFDVAVRVGLMAEGSLTAKLVLQNEVAWVASPELLDRHGQLTHPHELARYPTVAYVSGSIAIVEWKYEEAGEVRSVVVTPRLTVNDGSTLLEAARRGCGVAYVSKFSAQKDLDEGTLVQVLGEVPLPAYAPIYMLTAPREYRAPKVEAFSTHLLAAAEKLA